MAEQSTSNFMGMTDGQESQSDSRFREFSGSHCEQVALCGCGRCRRDCARRRAPRELIFDKRAGADPGKTKARQMI
jgi:hypothetical protein